MERWCIGDGKGLQGGSAGKEAARFKIFYQLRMISEFRNELVGNEERNLTNSSSGHKSA